MNPRERELPQYNPERERDRYEEIESGVPGILLLAEPETKPKLSPDKVRIFAKLAEKYYIFETDEKDAETEQKALKDQMVKMAEKADGLRGVVIIKTGLRVSIFPSEDITWDRAILKKALGDAYARTVTETLLVRVNVPIPAGKKTLYAEDIDILFIKTLKNLGISRQNIEAFVKREVDISINKKELKNLPVKLPEKAIKEVKVTWKVLPKAFD